MMAILLFLKFQLLEAHKDGGTFQDLVHTVGLERLGISGSEISKLTAELVGCLHILPSEVMCDLSLSL